MKPLRVIETVFGFLGFLGREEDVKILRTLYTGVRNCHNLYLHQNVEFHAGKDILEA